MSRLAVVAVLVLGATLMAVPAPAPAAQPGKNAEDTRLANAFQTYLDEEFRLHPLFATQHGQPRVRRPAGRPVAGRPRQGRDPCEELARRCCRRRSTTRSSPATGRSTTRSGRNSLKYGLWSVENDNRFEFDPRVYGEYISDSVFLLLTQSTLPRERNVENAAKRIK